MYNIKDTIPYAKLKEKFTVFELQSEYDFQQAVLDNKGELFIEDTKAYLLTPNNRCYVLFYENKNQIKKVLNELNGDEKK
jgi:hypothetical protein